LQNSDHASLCASNALLVAVVSLSSSATLIGFTHPQLREALNELAEHKVLITLK